MIPLGLLSRFGKHLFELMFVPVDPSTDVDSVTSLLLSTLCTSAPLRLMTSTLFFTRTCYINILIVALLLGFLGF